MDRLLKDDKGLHAITSIKHQPPDFSHKQLLAEIERGQRIQNLFVVARRVIDAAGLSAESVRYYASLVDYYTVYKLKRMSTDMGHLYLLRFNALEGAPTNGVLLEAFRTMSQAFRDGLQLPLSDLPTTLIPQRSARYVVDTDGTIVRDRYEFVIYRLLRERLEAGDLRCPDSARYPQFRG